MKKQSGSLPVRDKRVSVLRKKHCNLKVTVLLSSIYAK